MDQTRNGSFRLLPDRRYQTIRYFGASACWWASGMGESEIVREFMPLLYTKEGLDLNNIRINIGGSVKADRSDSENDSPTWRGVLSPLDEDGHIDIRRCPGTWEVVRQAMALGTIDDLTLFMNSPPSSMTKNGKTNGDKTGKEGVFHSNLREDCYEAYAHYVGEVTEQYINAGIPVKYVSPINEPQWAWEGGQEGCHYEPEECLRIFRLVIRDFEERKRRNPAMKDVKVSIPETAQWYQRPYVHEMYRAMCEDPEIAPYVDHFCAHSYGTTREQKVEFAQYIQQQFGSRLPLHQTEWGPMHAWHDVTMDTGLELAIVLYEDLNILHVDSWCWWLGIGGMGYTDGMICYNGQTQRVDFPKRYYVMKQHSRFLRDHVCLGVDKQDLPESLCGAAYQAGTELVWELVNPETEAVTLTLKGMRPGAEAMVYETSDAHNCEIVAFTQAGRPLTLPARSVTTVVFRNGL